MSPNAPLNGEYEGKGSGAYRNNSIPTRGTDLVVGSGILVKVIRNKVSITNFRLSPTRGRDEGVFPWDPLCSVSEFPVPLIYLTVG